MQQMPAYIHHIFELISFFVAIIYYRYLKDSFMKWFLPFLGFIFICEVIGNYQNAILKEPAVIINYLVGIVESVFYGYIFYHLSHRKILKKAIVIFVPISVISYLITFYFSGKSLIYFFPNIVISGFFLAAIALFYLYERFADDDQILLISESGFWISVGVSLFYSGTSISFSLYSFILKNDLSLFGQKAFVIAPRVLSIILYLSISISLILWSKKNKKSLWQSLPVAYLFSSLE